MYRPLKAFAGLKTFDFRRCFKVSKEEEQVFYTLSRTKPWTWPFFSPRKIVLLDGIILTRRKLSSNYVSNILLRRESFYIYFILTLFKKTYDDLNIEGKEYLFSSFNGCIYQIKINPFQNESMQNSLPQFSKKKKWSLKILRSIISLFHNQKKEKRTNFIH